MQETLIARSPVTELQRQFTRALADQSIICHTESLHDICRQLDLEARTLRFDPQGPFTLNRLEYLDLILMRFDLLFQRPEDCLSRLTGRAVTLQTANRSTEKWYHDRYRRFQETLWIPPDQIHKLYQSLHDLIQLFYPDEEKQLLHQTMRRFAHPR